MFSKVVGLAGAVAISAALVAPVASAVPPPIIAPPSFGMDAPYSNPYGGANPTQFRAEVDARMQSRIDAMRHRVNRGELSPEVLRTAYSERDAVDRQIELASRDGLISRGEARHVWDMASAVGTTPRNTAIGGGPRR